MSSNSPNQPLISVVAPCYNEEEVLPVFIENTLAVLESTGEPYEFILVNDGSSDRTLEKALSAAEKNQRIRVLTFTRNFGHQAAVTAGLDQAQGRAVVIIDSDLQDPPEVITQMLAKWREGFEVVYGQRRSRDGETWFKLLTAKIFYRLIYYLTDRSIPMNTGDFRLMDQKIVLALREMRERHRFIRGMVSWVGGRQTAVLYDRKKRDKGLTHYSLRRMILFAFDAITSFSYLPLRIVTVFGAIVTSLAMIYGVGLATAKLLYPEHFIPGFTATVLFILFFGGIQILSVGILGEYVGRIYEEVKNRPLYVLSPSTPNASKNDAVN